MYTIAKNIEAVQEIKKSKFITRLYKVYSTEDIDKILAQVRKEHAEATHICYAYKLENTQKFSDDGEPGGTAGLPMMDILNKNELDYVLALVIRYFGGIKLGSGGLVRAYASSVTECLKEAPLKELIPGYQVEISTTYEKAKKLDYILKDYPNIQKEYLEQVKFTFAIEQEKISLLKEYNPKIIKKEMIEKDLII